MASTLSPQSLLFLILFYFSTASPLPPLIALNCTPPQSPLLTAEISKHIHLLLVDLTAKGTQTQFATSSFGLEPNRIDGLMQCQLYLSPRECTICIQTAVHTILTKCLNSLAVTAWLSGCYVHYYNTHKFSSAINATEMSQANQSSSMDQVQFSLALKTWISQIKVAVLNQSSHHMQFSHREVIYGRNNGDIVYGVAECIQAVSPMDCEVCLKEGTKKLEDDKRSVVVAGSCMVGCDHHGQKYSFSNDKTVQAGAGSYSRSGGSDVFIFNEHDRSNVSTLGFKEKVAWAWSVGVVCLVGVVLGAWCLRRKVVNNAKVGIVNPGTTADDVESVK